MRIDDSGPASILMIDPPDEWDAIAKELQARNGQKEGVVIILPNKAAKAFESPRAFYNLKVTKRQWKLQIVFIIPKPGQAQWAKVNNFTVYASWDELINGKSMQRKHSVLKGTALVTIPDEDNKYP